MLDAQHYLVDLDLTMDPYDKTFVDKKGARPFFFQKNFRYVNVYVNYGRESQIRAQLMTDTVYKKQDPTRSYYVFRIKLKVFKPLA